MMPADYEDLKSLAVERMTESMRFVISLAEEIEMWITDLCGTRKVRSAPEETIISASSKRNLRKPDKRATSHGWRNNTIMICSTERQKPT